MAEKEILYPLMRQKSPLSDVRAEGSMLKSESFMGSELSELSFPAEKKSRLEIGKTCVVEFSFRPGDSAGLEFPSSDPPQSCFCTTRKKLEVDPKSF